MMNDKDDTVVPAETCFTDNKGKSSDSDSVNVNESNSNTQRVSPWLAKRICYTVRSGPSATNFALCMFTTNWNVDFRTDSLLCKGSQWYPINKTVNKRDKLMSAQRTMTGAKGAV